MAHGCEGSIEALCRRGEVERGVELLYATANPPSDASYLCLLRSCHHRHSGRSCPPEEATRSRAHLLAQVKRIRTHLLLHGRPLIGLLGSYLVLALANCGGVQDAQRVSDRLPSRSVFTWTALIFAYAESDHGLESISAYRRMVEDRIWPNAFTFVGLFKACGAIPDLEQGKRFHAVADRQGFVQGNVYVGTALLSMYERCGAPEEAEQLFVSLDDRNVVSWNVMLSMYVQRGDGEKAVKLFRQMEGEGSVCADRQTLLFAIQACGILALQKKAACTRSTSVEAPCLEIGYALHRIVRRKRLVSDSFIGAALLKMYGRCSAVSEAENVFASLMHRDIVVWTTMLTIYIEQGRGESALELYTGMQAEDLSLDDASIVCILQGCCDRGSLGICESVHFAVVAAGCDENCAISATLIHAYGNCMSASDARAIFEKQSDPDVVSWNACISGYVGEGNTGEVICLFERLKGKIRPNDVTFMLVLSACSHSGLVAEGLGYLESMTETYGLDPNPKHYGIMIDLLGRRGEFTRISSMLKTMPVQADQTMWLSLLNSCESYGNVNLGEEVFHHAVCLDPYHATPYALMSKIYADAGWAECAAKIEHLRQHTVAYGI